MATHIVDAIVLELGLDPSSFTKGQQQAVQSLRQFEAEAPRSAQRAVEGFEVNVLTFFRLLRSPAAEVQRHLEGLARPAQAAETHLSRVAASSRRAGAAGEAAGLAVSAGVRALAIAGLGAVSVFELLKKTIDAVGSATQKAFGVGVGAAAAGMAPREFSAVAQALYKQGNVPQEASEGWLANFTQMQQQARMGNVDTATLRALAIAGIQGNALTMAPEDVLRQLAVRFAAERPETAIAQGRNILGMPAEMVLALRQLGAAFPQAVQQARTTAVSGRDVDTANRLLQAENQMETVWSRLWRTLVDDLDPALITTVQWATSLGQGLQKILDVGSPVLSFMGALGDWFAKILNDLSNPLQGGLARLPHDFNSFPKFQPGAGAAGAGGGGQNNPGNIRVPGSTGTGPGAFQSFSSPQAGVNAIGSQIDRYGARGINTLRGIISTWAPPSENPTAALIAEASARTGFSPDQPLNLSDPATRQKVIGALIMQEQGSNARRSTCPMWARRRHLALRPPPTSFRRQRRARSKAHAMPTLGARWFRRQRARPRPRAAAPRTTTRSGISRSMPGRPTDRVLRRRLIP